MRKQVQLKLQAGRMEGWRGNLQWHGCPLLAAVLLLLLLAADAMSCHAHALLLLLLPTKKARCQRQEPTKKAELE